MRTFASFALALSLALAAPKAHAEDAASACARTASWEASREGWSLRLLTHDSVPSGQYGTWALSLLPGQTYRVIACTPQGNAQLQTGIADRTGQVVAKAPESARIAQLDWSPTVAGRYIVVVSPQAPEGGVPVGVAVLYR